MYMLVHGVCSPWGLKESDTTGRLTNNVYVIILSPFSVHVYEFHMSMKTNA